MGGRISFDTSIIVHSFYFKHVYGLMFLLTEFTSLVFKCVVQVKMIYLTAVIYLRT